MHIISCRGNYGKLTDFRLRNFPIATLHKTSILNDLTKTLQLLSLPGLRLNSPEKIEQDCVVPRSLDGVMSLQNLPGVLCMVSDRLAQIQENLNDLYEQLGGKERALIRAPEEEKTRIRQQIRDLKKEIHQCEEDYLQRLRQESKELTFNEADAQDVIDVVIEEVTRIENNANAYPDELIQQVREIRTILEQPATPAALKIKPVISLLPPGIGLSIEGELDTESFWRKNFPTFTRLVRDAKK
jgi:chromosome segregation ATPase